MAEEEGKIPENNGMTLGVEGDGIPPPPVFMRDEPPTTGKKMDLIKWGLMHGRTEEELADAGFNPKTVRMAAYDLDKEGYKKRVPKARAKKAIEEKAGGGNASTAVTEYGKRALMTPSKPIPPEYLIEGIKLPMDGAQSKSFEQGLKFGASMLVLGVRVAQELSNMGMQQARPIMDMANAMRAGEALAAKNAAMEAAMLAAGEVRDSMMPLFAGLAKPPAAGGDPMKQMMTRMMEPMLQRIMGMFMPGVAGAPGTGTPPGWTRKTAGE